MRSIVRLAVAAFFCTGLAACGRTELEMPEDAAMLEAGDARDALDVPDAGDSVDAVDSRDVPPVRCSSDPECDNGAFCDGIELCVAGLCRPGTPIACIDAVDCTIDRCDEMVRGCMHSPDDTRCTRPARCDIVLGCTATGCTDDTVCNDGDPCTGMETCVAGRCVPGRPVSCDDGVRCTLDSCVPRVGCLNRPDNRACDDGVFCNGAERCEMTGCRSGGPPCDDGNPCTMDSCDEASRVCGRTRVDNDRDGFPPVSCGGTDCDDGDPTVNPGARELCADGRDNNCNGLADCRDPVCAGDPACGICIPTPENSPAACADGRDNDCDRIVDCADSDCSGVGMCGCVVRPENCTDTIDNDCDLLVDCADPDCATSPTCVICVPTPENTEAACADGRDNDCDRIVDCADSDCAGTVACGACLPSPETTDAACADRRDNDCDRLIDCADPDCRAVPLCVTCMPTGPENSEVTCADGRDNDCDLAADCADPGCSTTMVCRPPPTNDTCSAPITVGVPSTTTGTTAGARNDFTPTTPGFPGCAGGAGPDVVYTFTVGANTPMTIDVTALTGWDPVVYVRRDNCLMGAQTACNDDTFGLNSRVAMIATPGTYYVFVDGYGMGSQGAFELRISLGLPPENCGNFRDDDADGLIDCADSDCASDPRCMGCVPMGPENNPFACRDFRDNDCNGRTDCMDPACTPFCCVPTGPENTTVACMDGRDNDCNGQSDCADFACMGLPLCCRPTGPENTAAVCSDGRDNDCNGRTDCRDPGCAALPVCCVPAPEICNDGRDNDCDSAIDCADSNCAGSPLCGCVPTAMREMGVAACTDGLDNDCDGTRDCADSDCRPVAGGECCNGRDDNMNTIIDEFACSCSSNPDCVGVGAGGRFPSDTCYSATFGICGPRCNLLGGDLFCGMVLMGTRCDALTGQCR